MNHTGDVVPAEDPLSQAQRHVLDAEERVALQVGVVAEMETYRHPGLVAEAREVLATMEKALDETRKHLRMERERHRRSG
jgi:hypothetical protein